MAVDVKLCLLHAFLLSNGLEVTTGAFPVSLGLLLAKSLEGTQPSHELSQLSPFVSSEKED